MKPRAAHKTIKTIGTVSAGVALVLAGTVAWLLNKPATGDCGGEAPTNHKVHEIRATKVVVQPWLGEHHVYGIFMVPNRYKHSWQNVAFAPQSGSFTAEFDATPQNAAMAGVVGLSNGPAADYSSLAAIVRFNTSSMIDARNGGVYAASAAIPYSAGTTYHFRLVVSVPAHTYSVYVQSGSTAEQLLASNFSFRTEQAAASALNNLGLYASVGSETVCKLAVVCVTSAGSWQNVAFAAQSGAFVAEFDATPNNAAMDGVMGLSNGPAAAYTSLAAIVRFNTSGMIDAINGGAYAASAAIPYSAGTTYHVRFVVSVPAHTYSVYVRSGSDAEQLLASNFSFRTEQALASALNNLGLYASVGSETVCMLGPTCMI